MARCMIVDFSISEDLRQRARLRVSEHRFGGNSFSKFGSEQNRTLIGYLGEEIIRDYLGLKSLDDDYQYDLVYNGHRIEVKSVSCKFKPRLDYLCTVNSHDLSGVHKQQADFYVFTRIINDMSEGWILGFVPCSEFFEKGKFVEKGSTVIPGVKFWKANATVLPISGLIPIQNINKI